MKPIIGIEKSPTQVKLVEVDISTKPPKLLNFALIGLPSDNQPEALKYVKEVAATYKFKGGEVSITEAGDFFEHRIIPLPPMSKKNLDQVVNREIKTAVQEPPGGLAIGYKVVGKQLVSGIERNEVLIITAPQEMTRRLATVVAEVGWKVKLVTAVPIALLSLMRLHPDYEPQIPAAFILLDEYLGHLVIGVGDKLLFSRPNSEFPFENVEERAEKFAIDVNRSILYFGQRNRGAGQIEQVFVCGSRNVLPAINVALGNVLAQPIDTFDLSRLLDLSPLGERALEFETLAASFSIPIGAALELNRELPINLLPGKARAKVEAAGVSLKTKLTAGSALAATVLMLASTEVYLSLMKSKHVKLSNEQRQKLQEMQPLLKDIEVVQKERLTHQQQQNFLKEFAPSGQWESMLNLIATIIPNNVSLISLDIVRQNDSWELLMKGQAESEDPAFAFSAVNQFYYSLRQLPFFSQVRMAPPKMASSFGSSGSSGSMENSPEIKEIRELGSLEKIEKREKITIIFEIQGSLASKPFKLSELFEGGGQKAEGGKIKTDEAMRR